MVLSMLFYMYMYVTNVEERRKKKAKTLMYI